MNPPSLPISTAIFGSTGGCGNSCLAHTIREGIPVITLARNPEKLTNLLEEQGLDHSTINKYLTIVKGDATDVAAVKRTIAPEQNNYVLVPSIISGLGGVPKVQASLTKPVTFENPNLCENTMETIIKAIREILGQGGQQQPPFITAISTTGISDGKEDVPGYLRGVYHHVLATPHADKRKMEDLVKSVTINYTPAASNPNGAKPGAPVFRGFVIVRPSLLKGDHKITTGKGWKNMRVGTEEDPAVGCAMYRSDVGEWIFEELILRRGEKWINQAVTLTK